MFDYIPMVTVQTAEGILRAVLVNAVFNDVFADIAYVGKKIGDQ